MKPSSAPLTEGVHDELVDIIDEHDRVIGQRLKFECHAQGLLHRGASLFLFRDASFRELLLQQRSLTKANQPGRWNQIGGHVGAGETYQQAIERELREEMFAGRPLPPLHLEPVFKVEKDADQDRELIAVFRSSHPGPFQHDSQEVMASVFVPVDEVVKRLANTPDEFTATFRALFAEYYQRFLA